MYEQQQLSPEMVQAILALNQQQSEQARINRQQQMANMIRQQGQAGTQATSPGGGRVGAPNIMGNLANVYGAYKARGMDEQAAADQKAMDVQRQDAYNRIFQALTRKQAAAQRSPEQDNAEFL